MFGLNQALGQADVEVVDDLAGELDQTDVDALLVFTRRFFGGYFAFILNLCKLVVVLYFVYDQGE